MVLTLTKIESDAEFQQVATLFHEHHEAQAAWSIKDAVKAQRRNYILCFEKHWMTKPELLGFAELCRDLSIHGHAIEDNAWVLHRIIMHGQHKIDETMFIAVAKQMLGTDPFYIRVDPINTRFLEKCVRNHYAHLDAPHDCIVNGKPSYLFKVK